MAFNPGDSNHAYVYTVAGFQYSIDGAKTFTRLSSLPSFSGAIGDSSQLFAFNPTSPNEMFVVTTNAIYESTDWGTTFSQVPWSVSQPSMVATDPSNGQKILFGDSQGLHVTADGGTTWSLSNLGGAAGYPVAAAVDPVNSSVVFVITSYGPEQGGGVLRSTDGGKNFVKTNSGIASQPTRYYPYMYDLKFDPAGDLLALATGHGIFASADLGKTWVNLQGNAQTTLFTGLAWANGYLYASTWGQGVLRISDASLSSLVPDVITTTTTTTTTVTSTTSSTVTSTATTTSTLFSTSTVTVTTASTSTTTSTVISTSTSVVPTTSETTTTTTTTVTTTATTGGGGIPEFLFQPVQTSAFAILLIASYLLFRRGAFRTRDS